MKRVTFTLYEVTIERIKQLRERETFKDKKSTMSDVVEDAIEMLWTEWTENELYEQERNAEKDEEAEEEDD